jgi:hypothetical protein
MQQKLFIFILTLLTTLAKGQVKPPLAIEEYDEGLNLFEEIRLFELREIKERSIDTVLIIYHPASWAEYESAINPCTCPYNDTLSRYVFDTAGRISEYTYFQQMGDYSTTFHFDTLGNTTARTSYRRFGAKTGYSTLKYDNTPDTLTYKQHIKSKMIGTDSLVTIINFQKFSHGLDTATIEIKRYNQHGKLIEIQSSVNKKNELEFDDDTNSSTYHFKYGYDEEGRLIYYQDFSRREYKNISYPFYGKLTEIFDAASGQLKDRYVKTINEIKGVMNISYGWKQITLTRLEKGSKLFKLMTVVEQSEFPLLYYHEIVYKIR